MDPGRLAIRGGSAGGLTALNALVGESEFAACASWYGVTDLLGLVASTHDFEARYTDRLIGPLPEAHDLYEARSPVNHAAAMTGAVLLPCRGPTTPSCPRPSPSASTMRWWPPADRASCGCTKGRATASAGPTP